MQLIENRTIGTSERSKLHTLVLAVKPPLSSPDDMNLQIGYKRWFLITDIIVN